MNHTFHIPVLGLGYSIDTPLKVARYGISSVVSIVDDELTERMRKYHQESIGETYCRIEKQETDSRARRITAYLNLMDLMVKKQFASLKLQAFENGTELNTYFELLPEQSFLKLKYLKMNSLEEGAEKRQLIKELFNEMRPGSIDVNIMSKVDKANYTLNNEYAGDDCTDALAAMRGFCNSSLHAAVVISAGLNPRLYAYMERCPAFYPDESGRITKKIILKVSDYRSALIQAKMLAKKGLWVSEFRVESGLNCGGHAFATEGFLLGPILEEFKQNRALLLTELKQMYDAALELKGILPAAEQMHRITAQGGIGTAEEHHFLLNYYQLDAAGWGSPFLLVPEATNVDQDTLNELITAQPDDYYLSNSSPLGVLFNNFRKSTAEQQRIQRIEKGRPGSPCTKKFLCTNTEFTAQPICTASREYQHLKIKQLEQLLQKEEELENVQVSEEILSEQPDQHLQNKARYLRELAAVTEKVCLCEGLCASAYLKAGLLKPRENRAVSICPGPNLAFFQGKYTLKEMVNHIYGRGNLLSEVIRPNLFINELNLYVDYLKKDIAAQFDELNTKKEKYFSKFKAQLLNGISYYRSIIPQLNFHDQHASAEMMEQLFQAELRLS